jgi:hypothetical protein
MSKKIIIGAVVAVLASGPAFSQSVSVGDAQLAARAGVRPGDYTTAQMIQIINARQENDAAVLAYRLSQSKFDVTRSSNSDTDFQFGTDGLTPDEQLLLRTAKEQGDRQGELFILSGDIRKPALPASAVTPGEAQLAAVAHVDPADYTLAELIAMQPYMD